MKAKRSSNGRTAGLSLPSPIVALAVGVLCIAYVHLSHSASIPSATKSTSSKGKITSLRTGKAQAATPQPGRMKASDIKACISKAFCEVNSASRTPNYAVNKEFFDLMNQIHELSNEDIDSGSTSVEYDDDDDEDDDDGSSEESSSERLRGYPPPPPPPRYRRGREMELGNETLSVNGTDSIGNTTETSPKHKSGLKKKNKKKSKPEGQKMVKKFVNGTFVSVPKRRSRIETTEEKAEKKEFLNRKQREMGQVNDLAALIRISADIGLTLRSPRKCRTLFNKCTMSHEQIVDLFNQTLLAVTTPATSAKPSSAPTTKRSKVTTTLAAAITSSSTSSADTAPPSVRPSPLTTVQEALTPTQQTASTTVLTTQAPSTTTDDGNRSSKSRHDFSDEDVEYMTDTDIQPVHTYALFVNDAPEDAGKTVEETSNVQDTFKQYANAFPIETALPGDIPSLRKRSSKKKSLNTNGVNGRSNGVTKLTKRRRASSEEDDDDDEDEEDDAVSTSVEEGAAGKNGFRLENPYPGFRVNKEGIVDDDKSVESAEPNSAPLGKESSEGILPPLVQKEKPKMKEEDEEEDEEESSEEDDDIDADDETGLGVKGTKLNNKKNAKYTKSNNKKKPTASKKPSLAHEDESSEEDDIEQAEADDPSGRPPWTPVYQMYSKDKKKQGYSKKQKGPYKGGEGPYSDEASHGAPQTQTSSFTSFLKKPWGGNSHSGSQEIPGGGALPTSHEAGYPGYQSQQFHGGPQGGPTPYGSSLENAGGPETKPGFFQSIMSWFTGNKNGEQGMAHPGEGGYGAGPYGGPAGHGQHTPYGGHGSVENDEPHKAVTGAPWPNQPDPAGVGHFGQGYRFRGHPKRPASSEEDEELLDEPEIISKKDKKMKRRYRGRSDSIITSHPKKPAAPTKKTSTGPPPPVVIVPKDSKSVAPGGNAPVGVYEPNQQHEKLIQADGGITTGSNAGKKVVASSPKENKRSKKAATKPAKSQDQNKKSKKQSQRTADKRTSRESAEDDDEAYSSEELYNHQVAKMKKGSNSVSFSNSASGSTPMNDSPAAAKPANSFPSYFESMFGTEDKDKYKIKGKDDGTLLYGFDSLSSHLSASPVDLAAAQTKKKESSYKINKNKKRSKISSQPVKFNNKEVIESSEEEEKRK